jgi:hypothetical protein
MDSNYENFINNYTLNEKEEDEGIHEDDNSYFDSNEPFLDDKDKNHFANIDKTNLNEKNKKYNETDYYDNEKEEFTSNIGAYKLVQANIPENKRTYSSIWDNDRIGTRHARSVINSPQAWSSKYNRVGQFMKIDLGSDRPIGGIIVQGRDREQRVTKFHIRLLKSNGQFIGRHFNLYEKQPGDLQTKYRGLQNKTISGKTCQRWDSQSPHKHNNWSQEKMKTSGIGYHNYCRNPDNEPKGTWCYTTNQSRRWEYCNAKRLLSGKFYMTNVSYDSNDGNNKQNIMFNNIETARYVWIYPIDWVGHISMRADVYIEISPKYKLIVGSHPESSRKYSTIYKNNIIGSGHARSMINSKQAWSAARGDEKPMMEIDMGYNKKIGGVIIQKRQPPDDNQYVTKVNISTQSNGGEWVNQLIGVEANTKSNKIKKIEFMGIVETRKVRFHILGYNNHISMRADVLMVDDNTNELLANKTKEQNELIKIYEAQYKDVQEKAKHYLANITKKNMDKPAAHAKITSALDQIKSKLYSYRRGATKYRTDSLSHYSDNMILDKEQLNNYFNTLYSLYNDKSHDISLDKRSLNTGNNILERQSRKISNNNKIIKDLDNYIDTYDRQKGVVLDNVLKRDSNVTIIKLVTICLMVLVFIYLAKQLNILNSNIALYCSYFIIVLFLGIGLFKLIDMQNRNTNKYEETEFKNVNNDIKSKKDDI